MGAAALATRCNCHTGSLTDVALGEAAVVSTGQPSSDLQQLLMCQRKPELFRALI